MTLSRSLPTSLVLGLAAACTSPGAFAQQPVQQVASGAATPLAANQPPGRDRLAAPPLRKPSAAAHRATTVASRAGGGVFGCSPAPCTLPNVNVSAGRKLLPVNSPAMAINPVDKAQMLVAATDYNCEESLQGIFASHDGGSTWQSSCMARMQAGFGGGYAVPAFDSRGTAYVSGSETVNGVTGVVAFVKSTDGGLTWAPPALAASITLGPGSGVFKPWLEVDTGITSPYRDSLYVSATQAAYNRDTQISVSSSHDGGQTWSTVNVSKYHSYPRQVDFSDLAIARDGTIYVSYMECNAGNSEAGTCAGLKAKMFVQKSSDGGASWSSPVQMAKVQLAALTENCIQYRGCLQNTSARMSNIPAIAVDNSDGPHSGKLYSVMFSRKRNTLEVQMVSSSDGGARWTKPTPVSPVTNKRDQFLPWVSVSDSGAVGVTWLDRRNDPFNINYEAFAAVSLDGGRTFGRDVKLSNVASDPWQDGFTSFYLGDYTGSAWSGDTLYMVYNDNRLGTAKAFMAGLVR